MLLPVIYIAFISLGLPDSMLGSAWPSIQRSIGVPESYAGLITALIYTGTIISSMSSGWITARLGTRCVVFYSILLTAATMYGFSTAETFTALCLLAMPYGLGGGAIDAALNNYVALHYKPAHMNFLHCFWGIGTITGPLVMGSFIESGGTWSEGYRAIAIIQAGIAVITFASFPLCKNDSVHDNSGSSVAQPHGYLLKQPYTKNAMAAFFLYCAAESTLGLWTVSYMIDVKSIGLATATALGMMFYAGITAGRIIAGLLADRLSDTCLIKSGTILVIASLACLMLSQDNSAVAYAMIFATGVGCGPIFPCMLHRTPQIVGKNNSQTLIGAQIAAASLGSISVPALFGVTAGIFGMVSLPLFCIVLVAGMAVAMPRLK